MPDIKYLFGLEPKEAVEYLENKGYKITNNWYEMLEEAHAKAFTVSKMTDINLLKDTHKVITQAVKEGWSSSKAERELKKMYQTKGWLKPEGIDGDKEKEKEYSKYLSRRVKTIFRTNMQTAYASARYLEQLQDVDFAPYLQYKCVLDESTRAEHLALHDKVFRYDDPFWAQFYPPNGWGCRCYVVSLTENELKAKGLKVEKSVSSKEKEDETNILSTKPVILNEDTGASTNVGVFETNSLTGNKTVVQTDAGWGYNAGAAAWNIDVKAYEAIKEMPQLLKDKFISDMALSFEKNKAFENFVMKVVLSSHKTGKIAKTAGWFTSDITRKIIAEDINLTTPVVVCSESQIDHILRDNKKITQKLSIPQTQSISRIIVKPDSAYIETKANGTKRIWLVRFIDKDKDGKDVIKIVVHPNYIFHKEKINLIITASRIKKEDLNGKNIKRIK